MLAVLSLAALLWMPPPGGSTNASERVRLPDGALTGIVGGAGAALTDVQLPQDIIKPNFNVGSPSVSWNKGGARCQFSGCGTSQGLPTLPSNQGYNVTANYIAVLSGAAPPVLQVFGDGQLRAQVTGTFVNTLAGFDIYNASLATKCVGNPATAGAVCNSTNVCGQGGLCFTCDGNGNCSNSASKAPCVKTCQGGVNAGLPCTNSNPDCPYGPASPQKYLACSFTGFPAYASTCYALDSCGSGTGCTDCRQTGAGLTSGAGGNNRNLHTVSGRVTENGTVLINTDRVYQVVMGDSSDPMTTCSANCNGLADALEIQQIGNTQQINFPQFNCN